MLACSSLCPSHPTPSLPLPLQPVPSGRTALAAPRNATACGNIPLAATPRRGAASAGLHTGAPAARKVRAASRETESNRSPAPLQVGPPPRPRSCSRRRETKLQFLSSDDYLFLFLSFLPLVCLCGVCVHVYMRVPPMQSARRALLGPAANSHVTVQVEGHVTPGRASAVRGGVPLATTGRTVTWVRMRTHTPGGHTCNSAIY